MKSLLMPEIGKLELIEDELPVCGEEEAVVRIKYAGICGSDLHIIAGDNARAKVPLILGHECCGTVCQIHSKRRADLKPGDKVTVHAVNGCGVCDNCRNGRENLCEHVKIMGTEIHGMFREYIKVRADRLLRFEDDVDMRAAALVEPLTIGVHDVRRAKVQAGEEVFISGCGTIGLLIGMVARLSGARVVLSEINDGRIETGKRFGFTVLDRKSEDFSRQCAQLTRGKLFDKVFEVSGVEGGFQDCLDMVKPGATLVQVGLPGVNFHDFNVSRIIFNEINFLGVRNSCSRSMSEAVKLVNRGVLNEQLMQMISEIYPKEKAVEAFHHARTDKNALKILIDFEG